MLVFVWSAATKKAAAPAVETEEPARCHGPNKRNVTAIRRRAHAASPPYMMETLAPQPCCHLQRSVTSLNVVEEWFGSVRPKIGALARLARVHRDTTMESSFSSTFFFGVTQLLLIVINE